MKGRKMKRKKLNKPVIAEGEVTGHTHQLEGNVKVYQTGHGTREFDLDVFTNLTHQEHKTITLPPGQFESGQALEYDPFQEEARSVRD